MTRGRLLRALKYLVIGLLSLLILVPFWAMIVNSFKSGEDAATPTLALPVEWRVIDNYATVIERGNLVRAFLNSVIITGASTVLILFCSTTSAFVFGRRRQRWIKRLFYLFMFGIIAPPSVVVSTRLFDALELVGTYSGMILYYGATFCALPIFILTGFMTTIPRELDEAGIVDGARHSDLFARLTLPLLKPAIATCFIWIVLRIWNDFQFPLYILGGAVRKYTMVLSVYAYIGTWHVAYNYVFANLLLVSIPVVVAFLFAQRHLVQGLTAGAVKG